MFDKAKMQEPRISLNDDTADHDVKAADNEIEVVWNLRLSCAHRRPALTDLYNEAAYDLRLAHPFSGEKQIAEELDAPSVPVTAEVLGFDTAEIGRSLRRLHRATSMLVEIPPPSGGRKRGSYVHRLDRLIIKLRGRQL